MKGEEGQVVLLHDSQHVQNSVNDLVWFKKYILMLVNTPRMTSGRVAAY